MKLSDLEPTGVYLKKGDTISIESDNEDPAYLMLGPYGKYSDFNDGQEFTENVALQKGNITYEMKHESAIVYIRNLSKTKNIQITIKGGRKLPTYKLGVTDEQKFREELEETTDAPFYELVGDRTFGTFQYTKTKDSLLANPSIKDLVQYLDKLWELEGKTYGLIEDDTYGVMNKFKERLQIINTDTGGGIAYAANNYLDLQVSGGQDKILLSYTEGMDQWAIWHEMGHIFQSPLLMWSAGDTDNAANLTEVSVNIGTLYVQKSLGLQDRLLVEKGKGEGIRQYLSAPNEGKIYESGSNSETVFNSDTTNWIKLGMFDQLMMAYGNDIYSIFMKNARIQKLISPDTLPQNNEEKRQYFMKSMSEITQRNLKKFFDKWGLHADENTIETFNRYSEPAVNINENLIPGKDSPIVDNIVTSPEIPTAVPKKNIPFTIGQTSSDFKISDLIDPGSMVNLPSQSQKGIKSEIKVKNGLLESSNIVVELENDKGGKNIINIPTVKNYGNAVLYQGEYNTDRIAFTLQSKSHTLEAFFDENNKKQMETAIPNTPLSLIHI